MLSPIGAGRTTERIINLEVVIYLMSKIVNTLFPEPPKNNNREHPVAEDITRVVIGSGLVVMGPTSEFLAYKLGKEVFTERKISEQTYQSTFDDVHPIYKADIFGAEAILTIGGPILAVYGYRLASNAIKSLYLRIKL